MEYKVQAKVTGVKFFDGEIDGDSIDVGTVFVEEKLNDKNERAKGYASTGYGLKSSKEAKALMHNEFPMVCELTMENVTTGKTTKPVVLDVKPLQRGAQPKAA